MTDPISDKRKTFNTLHKLIQTVKPPLCGKIVKTYDNSRKPCLRPEGHEGGCNPFSDSPALGDQKKKG